LEAKGQITNAHIVLAGVIRELSGTWIENAPELLAVEVTDGNVLCCAPFHVYNP
jgi:hypothetical protein